MGFSLITDLTRVTLFPFSPYFNKGCINELSKSLYLALRTATGTLELEFDESTFNSCSLILFY